MKHYTTHSLYAIVADLQEALASKTSHEVIAFEVLNPDVVSSSYGGTLFTCKEKEYVYRSYKTWSDLAHLLFCKMLTPREKSETIVEIRFQKLDTVDSFHTQKVLVEQEKYGVNSPFFSIHKNEESAFLLAYVKALESVKIETRKEVLNLGINGGDEFSIIKEMLAEDVFRAINFVGVDYSASAVAYANARFREDNVTCKEHDINALASLELNRADLIISIGTLQSASHNFKTLFMSLVQNHLSADGALILGFPNSRWIDGELIYGAKAPNYAYSEMSILIKDIYFCKKYLQQHKFRVTLTGKEYLFLTATRIGV